VVFPICVSAHLHTRDYDGFPPFISPYTSHSYLSREWKYDENFEGKLLASTRYSPKPLSWVDWLGNSVGVSAGVTATEFSREDIDLVV